MDNTEDDTLPSPSYSKRFVRWTIDFPASEGYSESQVRATQEKGKDGSYASDFDRILYDEQSGQGLLEKDARRLSQQPGQVRPLSSAARPLAQGLRVLDTTRTHHFQNSRIQDLIRHLDDTVNRGCVEHHRHAQ